MAGTTRAHAMRALRAHAPELPPGTAQRLRRFLRDLHAIDAGTVTDLIPTEDAEPGAWLEDLHGPRDLIRVLHATRTPPSRHRVVAHADLGGEHLLELDGRVTGIIDWSDAAVTDPALDFARLYRDFGPGGFSGPTLSPSRPEYASAGFLCCAQTRGYSQKVRI